VKTKTDNRTALPTDSVLTFGGWECALSLLQKKNFFRDLKTVYYSTVIYSTQNNPIFFPELTLFQRVFGREIIFFRLLLFSIFLVISIL